MKIFRPRFYFVTNVIVRQFGCFSQRSGEKCIENRQRYINSLTSIKNYPL